MFPWSASIEHQLCRGAQVHPMVHTLWCFMARYWWSLQHQWHHIAIMASQITGSMNICSTTFYAGVSKYIPWFTLCGALWMVWLLELTALQWHHMAIMAFKSLATWTFVKQLFNVGVSKYIPWFTLCGALWLATVESTALQWHHMAIMAFQITGNLNICKTTF